MFLVMKSWSTEVVSVFFVLMDAILLYLDLQNRTPYGNFIFQLSTLLSNEFEANIQKLEGYFGFYIQDLFYPM